MQHGNEIHSNDDSASQNPRDGAASPRLPFWVAAVVVASLLFGVVARLIWVSDMEWKADEVYTVEACAKIVREGVWPATGMGTSVGLPNPGLSVWAFLPLAAFDSLPTSVCRAVMILNVLAMLGFAGMAVWSRENHERVGGSRLGLGALASREACLWGIALFAVNPYCIRIARKIWPPSLLAPLLLLLWVGRSHRSTRLGALAWGLAGATMGQIHLSGFFLAGGVFGFTVIEQLRGRDKSPTRWLWWVAGSLIGAASLISWWEATKTGHGKPIELGWTIESFRLRILLFWQYWFEIGCGLTSSATYTGEYSRFLAEPSVFGYPTGLISLLHQFVNAIGTFGVVTWVAGALLRGMPQAWQSAAGGFLRRFRRRLSTHLPPAQKPIVRKTWKAVSRLLFPRSARAIASDAEARFYAWASLLGGGGLLILACRIIHLHYLVIFTPFLFVWLALVMAKRRGMLAVLVLAQALIASASLVDLHIRGGAPAGEYGVSYRAQKH